MSISLSGLTSGVGDIYSSLLSSSGSSMSGVNLLDSSSLLSDYAAIKNGSYTRMLKAYYAKLSTSEEDSSSSSSSVNKAGKDATTASSASSAYKSATALSKLDYSEDNKDKIYDSVSSFIKDYNSMIKNASNSSVSSVNKQADYLNNITYSQYKTLAAAGITMNSDRTLSINENTFKKANMSTIKTLFKGSNSFADQVSSKASQIYRYASSGNSSVASLYTGSGTYSSIDTSSLLNSVI